MLVNCLVRLAKEGLCVVLANRPVSKLGAAEICVLLFIERISSRPESYRIRVNDTAVNCQELYCCLLIQCARVTTQIAIGNIEKQQ